MIKTLVLASSSPFRRELLARLQLPFQIISPDIDESPRASETPLELCQRLAVAKARRVEALYQDALIIGSDQVATLDQRILGKPGNHANAVRQLQAMRGQTVLFHTALALLDVASVDLQLEVDTTRVRFRQLNDQQIEHYLQRDRPYASAGSAKVETLGIALLEAVESDDPTAIIGLPLIRLVSMLARAGIDVLA